MFRRTACLLPLLLAAGCAAPGRVADSPPPARAPAASRPAAPRSLPERVRRDAWLARFWEQLTPAQRRRVLARLRRGNPPLARTEAEAAPVWDALGLPQRDALVFGAGLPPATPPPAAD